MKDKQAGNGKAKATRTRELPVEEFARLVDGLDAASIESACAQDGAEPGGLPPGWADGAASIEMVMNRLRQVDRPAPGECQLLKEADWDESTSLSQVVARGGALAALGVKDGDVLHIEQDAEPSDGDLVIVNLPGMGRLLRQLRFVGGAALLCSADPERPAITMEHGELSTLRVAIKA